VLFRSVVAVCACAGTSTPDATNAKVEMPAIARHLKTNLFFSMRYSPPTDSPKNWGKTCGLEVELSLLGKEER